MSDGSGADRPKLSCDQAQDWLGAYVLDSLDDADAAAVRRHLAECGSCGSEAEGLRATAMQIGEAVEAVTPPAALRQRILNEVSSYGTSLKATDVQSSPASTGWSRASRLPWIVAAAAAVLMLAAGSWGLTEHFASRTSGAGLTLTATSLSPVDRLIASGVGTVLPLRAQSATAARGALVTNSLTGVTYLLLSGVPSLTRGRDYTLWYIGLQQGTIKPIAIGDVTHSGAYLMPRSPRGFVKVALTREPGPHDTVPRGPVLLAASLA